MKFKHNHNALFVVIVVIYLVSQILLIQERAFWRDEAATGMHIFHSFSNIWEVSKEMAHAPVYYFLLKIWATAFGYSDGVLSAFSLFLGLISLLVTFFFSKNIWGKQGAITLTAITILHAMFFHYCMEAKQYMLVYLLSLMVVFISLNILNKIKTNRDVLFEGLMLSMVYLTGVYTHPWFLIYFAAGAIIINILIFTKINFSPKLLNILIPLLISAVLSLPALKLYFNFSESGATDWINDMTLQYKIATGLGFLFGKIEIFIILSIFLIGLIQKTNISLIKGTDRTYNILLVAGTFVIGIILDYFFGNLFYKRYLFIILPPLLYVINDYHVSLISKSRVYFAISLVVFISYFPVLHYIENERFKIHRIPMKNEIAAILNESNRKALIATDFYAEYATYAYYNKISNNKQITVYPLPYELKEHPGNYENMRITEDNIRSLIKYFEKNNFNFLNCSIFGRCNEQLIFSGELLTAQ